MARLVAGQPTTVYSATEGDKFNTDTTLTVVSCCTCGIRYAIPASLDRSARKYHSQKSDGWWLCCPLGHTWGYVGKSDEERLREQLSDARDSLASVRADRDQIQASLRSTKGVVTRQKKKLQRVTAGVCPCCNRTFQNLARHMGTKHPDYEGGSQP